MHDGINREQRLALGIDIGGTKIKAGLVDEQGQVLTIQSMPTEREKGADDVLNRVVDLIKELGKSAPGNILGVGLTLPGEVDQQRGFCLYCPNLQWGELEVSQRLTKATGFPIKLINDANAACLGEYLYGGGQGVKTFLSITLGTGVGSGLILDGRLYTGRFGSGMEAGHMVIDSAGPLCSCGRRGCWETFVAAPAIIERTREKRRDFPHSRLSSMIDAGQQLSPEKILQASRDGDSLAWEVVEETISYLAIGLANLINLFNPYKISLGGGLAEAKEIVSASLYEQVNNNVYPTISGKVEIFKATQGYYGGVIGAASLWLHEIGTI